MHCAFALPPFGAKTKRQITYGDSAMFYDSNEEFDYDFGSRNLDIPTSTTTTEATRTLQLCMGGCVTTSEYNPVCGSDNVSYDNEAKLNCAVHCGKGKAAI
jgi:Kazal-type serine protease inhibitor domain